VRWYRSIFLLCIFLITGIPLGTQAQSLSGPSVMVEVNDTHPKREVLSLKVGDVWQPMLAAASAVHIRTDAGMYICTMTKGSRSKAAYLLLAIAESAHSSSEFVSLLRMMFLTSLLG